MKKNKDKILGIIFAIFLTMMFFTYSIIITYDTSHYLWLTSLLTKDGDFSTWDIARGPIFPLIIRVCNMFFGYSVNGILVGMFTSYLIMILGCLHIYRDTIKNEENLSKKMKIILAVLFFVLIIINPMIFGYYHVLLTEFVAITLAVIGCYISWKWLKIDFKENKIKYSLYTLLLASLLTIAWLLKQPYSTTILFPLIISSLISIIRKCKLSNIIQRIVTIVICVIFLIAGIKIWDFVIYKNNVKINPTRTSSGFLTSGIISGATQNGIMDNQNYSKIEQISNENKIKDEDKEKIIKIIKKESESKGYVIIDDGFNENYSILYTKNESVSMGESIKYVLNLFKNHPGKIVKNYINNYLATISIHPIEFDSMRIIISDKIDLKDNCEISVIGYRVFDETQENIFPVPENLGKYTIQYKDNRLPIRIIDVVMRKLEKPINVVMKLAYILLPILTIYSIIMVFKTKNKYNEKYQEIVDIIAILYAFSFLHIVLHAFLGATIDRYTVPALATTYLGILLNIYAVIQRKKYKV